MNIEGRYNINVIGTDGEVKSSLSCHNIVTNLGKANTMNGMFGDRIAFGTGRAQEALSTTALGAQFGKEISGKWSDSYASSIDVSKNTIKSSGVLIGRSEPFKTSTIITELGIKNSNGELSTYSLLRDVQGELTTVTLVEGEILEVEYEIVITCKYVQEMPEESGLSNVVIYRLPPINRIPNTYSETYIYPMSNGDMNTSEGAIPSNFETVGSAGTTSKNNKTFEAHIPASILVHKKPVFGFMLKSDTTQFSRTSGFVIGAYLRESFTIDPDKDYSTKIIFEY